MDIDPEDVQHFHSYTHARRHPAVLGKVGGTVLPFGPYSTEQLVAGGAVFVLTLLTRPVWSLMFGGSFGTLLMFVGAPGATMWAARNLRPERRSPLRAGIGLAKALAAPSGGMTRNRPQTTPRPRRLAQTILISGGE